MEQKDVKSRSSSKPLAGQVYYLDVKPSKRNELLKLQLKKLGGHLEDFLSKDVNYLVTDRIDGSSLGNSDSTSKANVAEGDPWLPETPASGLPSPLFTKVVPFENDIQFPDSPVTDSFRTPTSIQTVQSRGQALLERAVKHKTQKQGSADMLEVSRQWGIKILPVKTLLNMLESLLKSTTGKAYITESPCQKRSGEKGYKVITLRPPYIKVEDIKRNYRPFYRQLQDDPNLFLERHIEAKGRAPQSEDENEDLRNPIIKNSMWNQREENKPIGLAAKAKDLFMEKKKKQVPKVEHQKRKQGYCEICNESYKSLSKHVLTKDHTSFVSNDINFAQLKELVRQLPTTRNLRQRKRPLSEINQENQDNQHSSHKPQSQPPAKAMKEDEVVLSSSSPLIRRPKLLGVLPEKLFSDSEDECVEASCSTADCQIPGCFGGPLCLSGPLFREHSSGALPLQCTANCKRCDCSCSSPPKPAQAHLSSSSSATVPFISLDIQPLNLSTNHKHREDKENSPAHKCKRQSDHVFFSENAQVSSFGVKENCANANSVVVDTSMVTNDTALSFSNLTFQGCPTQTGILECNSKKNAERTMQCVSKVDKSTNPTEKESVVVLQELGGVHSVRKALFMSDSTSPVKMLKPMVKPLLPLFDSSDKSFSQCSLSDQMLDMVSSDDDSEKQPVLMC